MNVRAMDDEVCHALVVEGYTVVAVLYVQNSRRVLWYHTNTTDY